MERLLATVPEDGRYRVRLLRKGSLLECFVADQVAISYRIYQERDKMFGLFVQEGERALPRSDDPVLTAVRGAPSAAGKRRGGGSGWPGTEAVGNAPCSPPDYP